MKRQFLIIIAMMACLWMGCSEDDDAGGRNVNKIYFSATISDPLTKADGNKFSAGNIAGIYVVDYSPSGVPGVLTAEGNRADNVKHWQSAAGLSADVPILWGDASRVDVYGYYPYSWSAITDISRFPFSVYGDQTTPAAFDKSDFLWTKVTAVPQPESVQLLFNHRMSKMVINMKSDASVPGALIDAKVRILGVDTAAVIDLSSGEVKSGETPATGNISPLAYEKAAGGYEITLGAILVPQTVLAGKHFLEITTVAGHVYNYNLTADITFPAGYLLPLNVMLKSGELLVEVGEIADWGVNGSIVSGDAEIAKPYVVGDFYNEGGVQGIVFEVDETGEHGKIVSLDENICKWSTENILTNANSESDGMSNMNVIKILDPTLVKYPTFKWCDDKNKEGITGWYMPANTELKSLYDTYTAMGDTFNDKITGTGVAGATPILLYNDYFCSTETNFANAYHVSFMGGRINPGNKSNPVGICTRAVYAF